MFYGLLKFAAGKFGQKLRCSKFLAFFDRKRKCKAGLPAAAKKGTCSLGADAHFLYRLHSFEHMLFGLSLVMLLLQNTYSSSWKLQHEMLIL